MKGAFVAYFDILWTYRQTNSSKLYTWMCRFFLSVKFSTSLLDCRDKVLTENKFWLKKMFNYYTKFDNCLDWECDGACLLFFSILFVVIRCTTVDTVDAIKMFCALLIFFFRFAATLSHLILEKNESKSKLKKIP